MTSITGGEDYATAPVPAERRVGGVNILLTWLGFILVLASMSFGGGLASELTLHDLVTSVLVGNAVLAVCGFVAGYIGCKSGLSFGSLAERVFGGGWWRLAILYVPLTLVGWYAIESSIFGNFIGQTFHLSDIGRRTIMAAAAIFFSVSAYIGVRFIGWASYFLIPTVLLVSLFALTNSNVTDALAFNFGPTHLDLSGGVATVMSTWIFSALLVVPDLARFVRKPFIGGVIGAVGVLIGNTAALSIGALAASFTKQSDPAAVLVALGYTPLALILTFASVWSTNDNNMYSSSLNVARTLGRPRRSVVVALAAIGAVVAFSNPAKLTLMFSFLKIMGASASPLGGIVLGSYLLNNGGQRNTVLAPWLAWATAATVAYLLGTTIWAIPAGLILGFLLWWIFDKIEGRFRAPGSFEPTAGQAR
jgi:cytosine permease